MTAGSGHRLHPAAVRKFAALAVAVPGLNLVVYQRDWPPIHVAEAAGRSRKGEVWISLRPQEFRDELVRPPIERRRIGPALGSADAEVWVELAAGGTTTIDDAGLFTARVDAHTRSVGFVALSCIAVRRGAVPPQACGADSVPCELHAWPRMTAEVDDRLGTQIVRWSHAAADPDQARLARALAFDSMLGAAVEEITLLAAER